MELCTIIKNMEEGENIKLLDCEGCRNYGEVDYYKPENLKIKLQGFKFGKSRTNQDD